MSRLLSLRSRRLYPLFLLRSLWAVMGACALLLSASARADLVILQYHHVSDKTPPSTSISPDNFRRHLELLAEQHMTVVDLPDAIAALQKGEALPERAVAITFDDAYESIYRVAFPMLKQRGWPFTIFVNPEPVDQGMKGTITWNQLREMKAAGAVIANHSMSHPYLINRPDGVSLSDWMDQQIEQAQVRLEAEIGPTPRMFAYPFGEYNLDMVKWLADHNYLAFGQQSGAVGSSSHWQIIPRYPSAGGYADVKTLKEKLKTLALPVPNNEAADPVLDGAVMPPFTMTLTPSDWKAANLNCFASGEGPIRVERKPLENGQLQVTVTANKPIPGGRSRYNCTAPSISKPGYFYWYSQMWVNSRVKNR